MVKYVATKQSHDEGVRVRFPISPGTFHNVNFLDFPRHRVLSYTPYHPLKTIQNRKLAILDIVQKSKHGRDIGKEDLELSINYVG